MYQIIIRLGFVQTSKRRLLADLVSAGGLSGRDLERVCEQAVAEVPASEADRARFLEDVSALATSAGPPAPARGPAGYDSYDYAPAPSRYYD